MDDEQLVLSAGVFDYLRKDERKQVFRQLIAKDINNLRKSCKLFSQLFSRSNPTLECLSYGNEHLKEDIGAILTVAIYDKYHALVTYILNNNHFPSYYGHKFNFYKFIYPYSLAQKNNDLKMLELLKERKFVEMRNDALENVDALLIASISRNINRVRRVISSNKFTLDHDDMYGEPWAVYIAIDNGDEKTLKIMFANEFFRKKIKVFGHYLLQRAIFSRKKNIFDFLIQTNSCNINAPMHNKINAWYHNFVLLSYENDYTLLDVVLEEHHILNWSEYWDVRKILLRNGALESAKRNWHSG